MIEIWRVGKTSRPQTVAVIQILPVNETWSLMRINVASMTRLLAFISLIFNSDYMLIAFPDVHLVITLVFCIP